MDRPATRSIGSSGPTYHPMIPYTPSHGIHTDCGDSDAQLADGRGE